MKKEDLVEESSATPRVRMRIKPNGSIRVTGSVDFVDDAGNVIATRSDFKLCRCGHSKEMPLCDSSHKDFEFTATAYCEGFLTN
jgi:CDGSH-type Zn-finger protein